MRNKSFKSIKKIVGEVLKEHISKQEIINEAPIGFNMVKSLINKLETSYGDDVARFFESAIGKSGKNIFIDAEKKVFLKSMSGTKVPLAKIEEAINAGMSVDELASYLPRELADGTEFRNVLVNKMKLKPKPSPKPISNIADDIFNYHIVTMEDAIDYLTTKLKSLKMSKIPKGQEREFVKQLVAQVNAKTKLKQGIEKINVLVNELEKLPLSQQKEVIKETMDEIKKAYPSVWKKIRDLYGSEMFTKKAYMESLKLSGYASLATISLDVIRLIWGEGEWKGHLGMNLGQTLTVKVGAWALPIANLFLNILLLTESLIRTVYSTFIADKEESKTDKALRKGKEKAEELIQKGKEMGNNLYDKGKKLYDKTKVDTTGATPNF